MEHILTNRVNVNSYIYTYKHSGMHHGLEPLNFGLNLTSHASGTTQGVVPLKSQWHHPHGPSSLWNIMDVQVA